jgi:hypothetical protein
MIGTDRSLGHVTLSGLPMLVFGSISLVLWVYCGILGLLKGFGRLLITYAKI